jgi:hypothetical protein
VPKKNLIALLVFVLTTIFYIYTLLPSLAWGDGVKLQSEAISGESFVLAEMTPDEFSPDPFIFAKVGVAAWDHPLYIVLGHLLVRAFPFIDSLWLINLISAIFGATSVALLFLISYRFTDSLLASGYASFSLAVSHTFWWHSSTPEVYTLFTFLLLVSFIFFDQFERTDRSIFLAGSAFFLGLAASTHILAFLAFPALGLYYLLSRSYRNLRISCTPSLRGGHPERSERSSSVIEGSRRSVAMAPWRHNLPSLIRDCFGKNTLATLAPGAHLSWRTVPGSAGVTKPFLGFLVGFSLYIIQFIRMSANFPLNEIMGPVVGSTFLSQLGTLSPILLGESLLSYLFFLTVQFSPIGLVLGILGIRKIFKDKDLSLRKIVSFFMMFALFGIFYRVTDQFTFFIASYVFWAILMGIGSVYAFQVIPEKRRFLLPVVLALLLLITPFFYNSLPRLAERIGLNDASIGIPQIGVGIRDGLAYYINPNKRGDYQAYDFGEHTISNLAPDSIVIAEWYTDTDEYFILRYFTKVKKVRSDVTVFGWPTHDPFKFDSQLVLQVIEESFPQHPVYLASLSERFYASSKLIEKYCIVPENNLYRLYQKENISLQCLENDSVTE